MDVDKNPAPLALDHEGCHNPLAPREVQTMADDATVTRALEKIAACEQEMLRLKAFVNEADKLNDQPPRFGEHLELGSTIAEASSARPTTKRWQAGAFFNKPFSTAVRSILQERFDAAGGINPASVEDIHDALVQGSFAFETSGLEAQKNSIRISLGKNSASFVKLPYSDLFGLADWWGKRTARTARKSGAVTAPANGNETEDIESDGDESSESEQGTAP